MVSIDPISHLLIHFRAFDPSSCRIWPRSPTAFRSWSPVTSPRQCRREYGNWKGWSKHWSVPWATVSPWWRPLRIPRDVPSNPLPMSSLRSCTALTTWLGTTRIDIWKRPIRTLPSTVSIGTTQDWQWVRFCCWFWCVWSVVCCVESAEKDRMAMGMIAAIKEPEDGSWCCK